MKLFGVLIIVLVASVISAEVIDGNPPTTNSTTSTSTTKATTTATTTTPTPTTKTTRTTTKTTPSSTKLSPTTTTTPTPATTPSTLPTTTPAKPTTTPASPDYWVVTDKTTGIKCILMQAKIAITYNNVSMNVPPANNGTKASGSCGGFEQSIELSFSGSTLKLVFNDTTESGKHRLTGLSLNETWLNINSTKFWASDKGLLSNKLYKCDAKVDLYTEGKNSIVVTNMKLEVFRTSNSTTFSSDTETCSSDSKVNNLVPIIVGACLGGLILIVLIAYLIGRKRSRHGYEQV